MIFRDLKSSQNPFQIGWLGWADDFSKNKERNIKKPKHRQQTRRTSKSSENTKVPTSHAAQHRPKARPLYEAPKNDKQKSSKVISLKPSRDFDMNSSLSLLKTANKTLLLNQCRSVSYPLKNGRHSLHS